MNKYPLSLGIALITVSLFFVGAVICNEIASIFGSNCLAWMFFYTGEFFYTLFPISATIFAGGIILLMMGIRSVSLISFKKIDEKK